MFLCVCITQYGLYVYMKYIDLYEDITEIDELKQCLRQNKTGNAKNHLFLAFLAHIVIAHTPAGKADLQAGATQPCL